MIVKYITFRPYHSGFSNIIMSYEIAVSLAYITKRTLVLPPKDWILFISHGRNPDDYKNIWELFDKDFLKTQINCIDYYDVPEFQGKFDEISGYFYFNGNDEFSYTSNMKKIFGDDCFTFAKKSHILLCDENIVFFNQENGMKNFREFCCGRMGIDLSAFDMKFIDFNNNLFGSYWYSVFAGNVEKRNEMKSIINKCFRYKNKFYDLAKEVKNKIGQYNSTHIRRNDFLISQKNNLESISNPEKLRRSIEKLYNNSLPLYISTDEKNKNFFNELRYEYEIYFYEDFDFNLSEFERIAVEQIICSESKSFYGTYSSTFSKRINVMRGIEGKQSNDNYGVNTYPKFSEEDTKIPFPWRFTPNKRWEWISSSYPQWTFENV